MKEVKIRLDDKEYEILRKKAKRELRSITKQVTAFILVGLESNENEKDGKKR